MTETADRRYVGFLESLRESGDRARLAALRRTLGKQPLAAPEAWPVVMRYLPEQAGDRIEQIYFLVGGLFALHPKSWPRAEGDHSPHDFGASMRLLANSREGQGVERRFAALLACDDASLVEHLRHAVALLKSGPVPIPVDWMQLISDLRQWNYERRPVQRKWARSFWIAMRLDEGQEPQKITGA
jgi:CRISPR system Cascade subunit CasB